MNPHEVHIQSCFVCVPASTSGGGYPGAPTEVSYADAVSTEARPAASIILLRRGGKHADRGLEVLMARRSDAARFMPGVWVFPGGAVDADEDLTGVQGDGLDHEERAHRACAVRELEEEVGVELGSDAELHAWSRWITPEPVSIRFDTRFYLALAPPHTAPRADEAEISDVDWFNPANALERGASGEISLVFPTIKHLESLAPYGSAEEALEAARERVVEPILPRVVGSREEHRILLPGDPDY
jgi:8-oxo-dGTP pyrophosphatase MutT (NUDIX family)